MQRHSYYQKSAIRADFLYVMDVAGRTDAEKTMLATLQGIAATRSSKQIYLLDGRHQDYLVWLEDLRNGHGVTACTTDFWSLFEACKGYPHGYILYRNGDRSANAACSLCGLKTAIAVEESLEAEVRRRGIIDRVLDVRGMDEKWVKENFWGQLNHQSVIEQGCEKTPYLRDYAAMTKTLIFADGVSGFRDAVMADLDADGACLGWGYADGEEKFVGPSSRRGVLTIPADWALNLSVLSGFSAEPLVQRTHAEPAYEEGVHYVAFLMSDGDNLQWALGDLYGSDRWWHNKNRGAFNMGWALSPSMADLAPTVMQRYYETAADGEFEDCFVAGPSGNGYLYPSHYPERELDLHVARLNAYMGRADLGIVEILDFDALDRIDLWDKYTAQPNVKALFYLEYSCHKQHLGAIRWSNGKPVITPREMLWDGLAGCDAASVARNINQASTDVHSTDGYSLVLVHAWSETGGSMDTLRRMIDGFNQNIRVVTPEVFVKLVQTNLRP